MSSVLDPSLALAYLGELSPVVTASALFDADGGVLAGDGALLERVGDAAPGVVVVREDDRMLVALSGSEAPRALVEFDARLAVAAVRGRC